MTFVDEGDGPRRRRRLRRRHAITLVLVILLLLGSFGYAAAYYQGWVGKSTPAAAAGCTPAATASTTLPAVKPGQIMLNVYNATDRSGLATDVAKLLRKRDFKINAVANDPLFKVVTGPAEVRYGTAGEAAAQVVAAQVPGARMVLGLRQDASVDLVLGQSFKALVWQAPPPPPPASSVHLNVFNTTFRTGLAGTAAKALKERGFKIGKVGNDPVKPLAVSAEIRYGDAGEDAARRVALQVAGAKLVDDQRAGATVDLVLGNAYTDLVPVAEATPAPVPTTPAPTPTKPRC